MKPQDFLQFVHNIKKVKEILAKDKNVEALLEHLKDDDTITLSNRELDRWNYPPKTDNDRNEDGTFDVEGLNCSDVISVIPNRWYMPRYWRRTLSDILSYFSDLKDALAEAFYYLKNLKIAAAARFFWIYAKYHPFSRDREAWVWVVSSKSSVVADHAVDCAVDIVLDKHKETHRQISKRWDEIQVMLEEVRKDPEAILASYMRTYEHIQISPAMWVQKDDPTCFIVDDKIHPYDLRDGWSYEKIAEAVEMWLYTLYGTNWLPENKEVKVRVKKDEQG